MSPLERIVASVGGDLFNGGRRALIPGPGHGPRDRSVSLLWGDDGRIIIHCFSPRDDWRIVRDALAARGLLPRAQSSPSGRATWTIAGCSEERTRANRVQRARQLWRESHSVVGTPGERYLRVRRIARDFAACRSLRFHPSMTGIDDRQRRPALVAAIRDSAGVVQGVEVVLLSADGRAKAAVAVPRRIVGRLMGGAVHLHIVAETLLVGEGVTTVLSASEVLGLNARALLSGHNLARFTPPAFVRVLVIAVDRDRAGWRAARSLVDRLKQDISVEIVPPPFGFNDWNDYARAG